MLKSSLFAVLFLCLLVRDISAQNPHDIRCLKAFWDREDRSFKTGSKSFKYGKKEIVFYGTDHGIRNPRDSQFTGIEAQIRSFKPELILTENSGSVSSSKEETIKNSGETGLCWYLAGLKDIQISSWDLGQAALYYSLRKTYTSDQLLFLTLSNLSYQFSVNHYTSYEYYHDQLVSFLEQGGYPFKTEQKTLGYYQMLFRKHFNKEMVQQVSPEFSNQLMFIFKDPVLHGMRSSMQQLRDANLINRIRQELKTHDRIFIQAGAVHLQSLESIIPRLLKESVTSPKGRTIPELKKKDVLPEMTFVNSKVDSTLIHLRKQSKSNSRILILSDQDSTIKSKIAVFKPDLFLTEGSGLFGDGNRQFAIDKEIETEKWMPGWDLIYDQMFGKYTATEINYQVISYLLKRFDQIPPLDAYEKTYDHLTLSGFPFQPEYTNAAYYFSIQGGVINSDFLADLAKIKTKALLQKIEDKGKSYQKILVQVSPEMMILIKKNGLP
ncbi:type 2 periplasmic-binding domain-containing protein [Pedobacter caeni]|uniref:TraB/GumN family protein n=1 Tax=Pedobacter caeni TaxID=288992 RepID=A0A1M5JT52_9SPHI|nr:hypothetical protein [Pedobacter caeni]SHG43585.1 hypothetical protein SAMN04488522_105497 [Pedobacter caeni]